MKKVTLMLMLLLLSFTGCTKDSETTSNTSEINTETDKTNEQIEQANNKIEGNLTISVYYYDESDIEASKKFMEKYPNTNVEIKAYKKDEMQTIQMEDGSKSYTNKDVTPDLTPETYIQQLNTQLMSKKADDIISISNMPFNKYTQMGFFEDLSSFIKNNTDLNDDNYYMNIINAYKDKDSKIFTIPTSYNLQVMGIDKNLTSEVSELDSITWNKILELSKQMKDDSKDENLYMSMYRPRNLSTLILRDNYKQYIDLNKKTVNVDSKNLADILNNIKNLNDNKYFSEKYSPNSTYIFGNDSANQAAYAELGWSDNPYIFKPIASDTGDIYINAYNPLAINSNSENKSLAQEYIKFLLSEDMQTSPQLIGIPVNKNGFKTYCNKYVSMMNENNSSKLIVSEQDYSNKLDSWISQINGYNEIDYTIGDFIYNEFTDLFDGKKSTEDALKSLQNKIEMYLNE